MLRPLHKAVAAVVAVVTIIAIVTVIAAVAAVVIAAVVEMYVIDLSIRTTTTKLGAQESFIDILISDIAPHLLGAKRDS